MRRVSPSCIGASWGRFALHLCGLAALAALSCRTPGRAGAASSLVSLYDGIPDSLTAGSWRVLAVQDKFRKQDLSPDGVLTLSATAKLTAGSTILVRLAYRRAWAQGGRVEAKLVADDGVTATATAPLGRSWAELLLREPSGGTRRLEIRHLTDEARLPLRAVAWLELPPETPDAESRRARSLASWAVRTNGPEAREALSGWKFGLRREGLRRDAVALTPGDTLIVDIPGRESRMKLRCWLAGLRFGPGSTGRLSVEAGTPGGWERLAAWTIGSLDPRGWRQTDVAAWIAPEARQLRFTLGGADEVVAIGSPILTPEVPAPRRNVILIDLDTMRADRLGCYGYRDRPTSERLDSLLEARGFTVFRRSYAAGPWTLPATAKFMTSRYHNIATRGSVPVEYTTLAEALRWDGYYCAAFTGSGVLSFPGFEQGFHEYVARDEPENMAGKVEGVFPHAETWLRSIDLAPFFLFVHTYETHEPYSRGLFCGNLPRGRLGNIPAGEALFPQEIFGTHEDVPLTPEERRYIQAAYDGGVRVACDATVDLLTVLDERDLWKNTVVVILSDHGEEFWEHSTRLPDHHGTSVYGELLEVPFILYEPTLTRGGMEFVDAEVSTVDLLPTIAQLVGVTPPEGCDGASLVPLLEGQTLARRLPIMALTQVGDTTLPVRGCLIADGLKYHEAVELKPGQDFLYPAAEQLYDLERDPREANDLSRTVPGTAREMASRLREGLATATPPLRAATFRGVAPLSPELVEQLRVLGYIGGEERTKGFAPPDSSGER